MMVKIAQDCEELWSLHDVIGALDGKHIRIVCTPETETKFHNYTGFYSLQLRAMCGARYSFTFYQYGSNNDTGVLKKS